MHPLPLKCHTRRLAAPETWNHARSGLCHTLEIFDAGGWMTSAWRPSALELQRLAGGAPLFLMIGGAQHPVVNMAVGRPEDMTQGECAPAVQSMLPTLVQAIVDATAFETGELRAALLDTIERETGFRVTR